MSEQFTGYDINNIEQDKELLRASEEPFSYSTGEVDPSIEIDPRPHLKMEMQGAMSSCTGHAITTLAELLQALQAGTFDGVVQLSRYWAYRQGQMMWQGRGYCRDNGCTVAHVIQAAREIGICSEAACPYPRVYGTPLPNAEAEAYLRRVQSHAIAESWEQTIGWVRSGRGGVDFGVTWNSGMQNFRGLVMDIDVVRPQSQSGHSFAGVGVVKHQGEDHLIIANSHSATWAQSGYALLTRRAYEFMLKQSYSAIVLVSDLTGVERKPRKLASFSMG